MLVSLGKRKINYTLVNVINICTTMFIFIVIFVRFASVSNLSTIRLNTIAVIAILTYAWLILSSLIRSKEFNFYIVFILMSFFFFYGQHFILLCGGDFINLSRSILGGRLPIGSLNQTGIIIVESMLLLHVGYLISNVHRPMNQDIKRSNISYSKRNGLVKIGLIMLLISIIPTATILVNNILTTIHFGYGALFTTEYYTSGGFNNVTKFLSLLTVPSLYILLISYRGTKKAKYIVSIFLLYLVLYLMSGSRVSAVLIISTLLLIQHFWFKPIRKREAIKYLMIFLILLLLLSTISSVRNSINLTSDPHSLIHNTVNDILENNLFYNALEEAGFTFLATATVITYCPSIEPYNNGMSYVYGLLAIFPNLFWDVHPASTNTDMVFKGYFTSYGGIGSSFIAEAYYNFGMFSLLLMPIFGWLLGYLCKTTKKAIEIQSPMLFYVCMYVSSVVLFYVRSDTITFWRNFVYYALIPCALALMINSKKKLDSKSNNDEGI